MKIGNKLVNGEFLERPNRYLAKVRIDGKTISAHVPDPGRLPGLLIPGRRARLIYNPGPKRKTDFTLALIRYKTIWVSVFPIFANRLVQQGLEGRKISCLEGYESFQKEVNSGNSRFDFQLRYSNNTAFVEVKSVSLVEGTVGKFPDAPTERGRKHVQELIELRKGGIRAIVLFISQRSDTKTITSNDAIDPKFAVCLREAHAAGVELYGYNCQVTASAVSLNHSVKVIL
ncbi:MAG: DNA/RNA nuclease SfsA [Nitrospinota bacterium]|nr:DNA/RNA nuclease SfsA [Nitrospinota bacterium]